jgi:hypothetical protein
VCSMLAALVVPSLAANSSSSPYSALKAHLRANNPVAVGQALYCPRCEPDAHTGETCIADIPRCKHCAKDILLVGEAHTHTETKCREQVKRTALASLGEGEEGRKQVTAVLL